MATTTPNFGWAVPTSTDLVKDGAVAIETLGDSIDASLVDLKGGTTGQVLAKATNTDMDFSWVAQDDSNAIQNAIVDARGDIIAATANDTPARLAVGANGTVLTADSAEATGLKWAAPDPLTTKGDLFTFSTTEARLAVGANDTVLTADSTAATGLKWATPASGGMTLLSTTTLTGSSVTVSSISGSYTNLFILFNALWPTTNGSRFRFRLNGSTSTYNYNYQPSGDDFFSFPVSTPSNGTNGKLGSAALLINNYANTTTWKQYAMQQTSTQQADDNNWVGGSKNTEAWTNTSAINSITIFTSSGNINGTMLIYGVK
jgi:hypothetical protein